MKNVVVFDLGGTLMEFRGMPHVWTDYYKFAFESINKRYNLGLSEEDINKSAEIMKAYNPRINYREKEIAPYEIFSKAVEGWNTSLSIDTIIADFFDGLNLDTIIYDYSISLLEHYKSMGYSIACLTDLPSGMPDNIFKKPLEPLIKQLDLYVSSQSCGYRKPNKFGLQYIADYFKVDISELLFIGDEKKDMQAAQNAGCKFKYINEIKIKTTRQTGGLHKG